MLHEEGPKWGLNADYMEWGILPLDPTEKGLGVIKANYEETVALAKAGKMDDINPEHFLKVFFFFFN